MNILVLSGDKKVVSAVEVVLHKILDGKASFSLISSARPTKTFDSLQETKKAAVARIFKAESSENESEIDYYISIVNGFEREFDSFYGFTYAAVSDKTKNTFGFGTSAKYPLPEDICISLQNGSSIDSLIKNDENGLVSIATNGLISIADLVSSSVGAALIPFHFYSVDLPNLTTSKANIESLTRFVGELNPIEKSSLSSQLRTLDFNDQKTVNTEKTLSALEKVDDPDDYEEANEDINMCGIDAIRRGEVGVCIMAGGQGSRLRAPVPKAMMEIGTPSKMTLLEIQLRKIKKLVKMFNNYGQITSDIPVYILTSDSTHSAIAAYLLERSNFGLSHVMLVKQKQLPARRRIDTANNNNDNNNDDKFVLSEKWKVLAAPNGNGAIFEALKESGALEDMKKRGVRYIDIHPIDNALARPADPFFVGAMIYEEADVAIKVIRKRPFEKIGTLCKRDGKTVVIEYSEIPPGEEKSFIWGNTGLHFYSIDVVERAANSELPYHIALKKENVIDENGNKVLGDVKKLECFIFDALEYAENTILVECLREEEFAPIKNAPGAECDSPDTARELIYELHKKWATDAEILLEGEGALEFLPETTYAGEGLDNLGVSSLVLPMVL